MKKEDGRRVGIMGGTFDPIHIAHLMLAQQAASEFQLDEILFMPSSQPPHKESLHVSAAEHRGNMVKLSIQGNPLFSYSDLELNRSGVTYTSDTLTELMQQNPDNEYYFIMGADSLYAIEQWHDPKTIFQYAKILVGNRMDVPNREIFEQIAYLKKAFGGKIYMIHMPDVDISSSRVRELCRAGFPFRYYVTDPVHEYILKHELYHKKQDR